MSFDGLMTPVADHAATVAAVSDAPLERLSPIGFGREICGVLAAAERREWWIGNGRGAYAAGTIAQSLTRRYHGLLVAPVDPPLGRCLVLAKADAELAIGDIRIEQRIWMEPGANTTYIAWRLVASGRGVDPVLSVALLANGRDHHGETWIPGFTPDIAAEDDRLMMSVQDRFILRIGAPGGAIVPQRAWIENFDLPVERERGLPDRDHHLLIGRAEFALAGGGWHGLVASVEPDATADIGAALAR